MTTNETLNLQGYRPASAPGPQAAPPPPGGRRPRRKVRRKPPPPPPRKSALGRVVLWSLSIVAILGASVAGMVAFLSPAELVRAELIRQVQSNTGRTLTIGGAPSLTFYPSVGVSLPAVALSPPPGMAGEPMMRSERIDVRVAFLPLLQQKVVVQAVNLVRPTIDLRVDRGGQANWEFAARTSRRRFAQLPVPTGAVLNDALPNQSIRKAAVLAATSDRTLDVLDAVELRSVRITGGFIRYVNETTGIREAISDANISIVGRRIADPMSLEGDLIWNTRRLNVTAQVETLRKLLANAPAHAKFNVNSETAKADYDGTITLGATPVLEGKTQVAAPSLAALTQWLGTKLPNGKPIGSFAVNGQLKANANAISLSGASIALGDAKASGTVSVRLDRSRPFINASMKVSKLDIDKLARQFEGAHAIARSTDAAATADGQQRASPQSIEQILRGTSSDSDAAGRFSPQVRGFTKRNGWSKEPIDVSLMQLFDADARLRIDGLRIAGLSIGQTALRTTLNSGSVRADIEDMQLYGGRGRGVVTARANDSAINVGLNLSISQVSAQPLLKDAADIDMIAGSGQLTAAVGSVGRSQHDIMSGLAGRASFTFNDGALIGWNIPAMLRGLQRGQVGGLAKTETQKTDFSELTANFTVSRGVANTQDLSMIGPLLRLSGSGNTDLGRRQLDMILRPKLVASLAGQGGQRDLTGLEVPVRITGDWNKPNIKPDVSSVLKNPDKVQETVKSIREQFKGKNAGEIVRDLLGGDKDGQGSKAGNILKQLFKN